MNVVTLQKWLAEPRHALVAAMADGVREHVELLRSSGVDFYGYALCPGNEEEVGSIVAVTNSEADIKVSPSDDWYAEYRYGVGNWNRFDHDGFAAANRLLIEERDRFSLLHDERDGYEFDEFEIAHQNVLFDAVIGGLEAAKHAGTFGDTDPFLSMWIPDSDNPKIVESVRRLNSRSVTNAFMAWLGEDTA